jgi:hypothetical protein
MTLPDISDLLSVCKTHKEAIFKLDQAQKLYVRAQTSFEDSREKAWKMYKDAGVTVEECDHPELFQGNGPLNSLCCRYCRATLDE